VVRGGCDRLWLGIAKKVLGGRRRTFELLVALEETGRVGGVGGRLLRGDILVGLPCASVNGISYDGLRGTYGG
jgi:hypothetical protein